MGGSTVRKPPADKAEEKPSTEVVDQKTGEVVEQKGGAVTAAADDDYGSDAGAGFENQTSEDVSIPFLVILQPGSPEVQEDAEKPPFPGYIINRTTGELYSGKDGVTFIPALTEHMLVEWKPRDSGGGFVGQHAIDSDLARRVRETQALGTYKHPDSGNDLVETYYVYGVAITADGAPFPATTAWTSTAIKVYKDFMFRARSIVIPRPDGTKLTKLPLFSHVYHIRTEKKEANGFTWYVPVVTFAAETAEKARLRPSDELYALAKSVHQAVSGGTLKAATDSLKRDERGDEAPKKGDVKAEDAPY